MGYVRITIQLIKGGTRSGVRRFSDPLNLEDIRKHAWQLAAEVLGRGAIANVAVIEVPADDPAVVALILRQESGKKAIPASNGEHPYVRQQLRKPQR
jgi:hypothetical protein